MQIRISDFAALNPELQTFIKKRKLADLKQLSVQLLILLCTNPAEQADSCQWQPMATASTVIVKRGKRISATVHLFHR